MICRSLIWAERLFIGFRTSEMQGQYCKLTKIATQQIQKILGLKCILDKKIFSFIYFQSSFWQKQTNFRNMKIVIQCQKVDQLAHRLVGWKWRLGTVFWQGPVQVLPPYLAPHLVIKWIVRMLYSSFVWLIILADGKIIKYWFHQSIPRSISISILLLEFSIPFVHPFDRPSTL